MKALDPNLMRRFADTFCFGRQGFSLEQIPAYFAKYEGSVPTPADTTTKSALFVECVKALSPRNQRFALYDLCDKPPASAFPMPDEDVRRSLLTTLVQADGRAPIGLELSALTLDGVREQWFTAASRLPHSPAGGITAARSLLESTCKTIILERGKTPDNSGDLARLYKQTRDELGLNPGAGVSQNIHRIANGLSQVVDGLAWTQQPGRRPPRLAVRRKTLRSVNCQPRGSRRGCGSALLGSSSQGNAARPRCVTCLTIMNRSLPYVGAPIDTQCPAVAVGL